MLLRAFLSSMVISHAEHPLPRKSSTFIPRLTDKKRCSLRRYFDTFINKIRCRVSKLVERLQQNKRKYYHRTKESSQKHTKRRAKIILFAR